MKRASWSAGDNAPAIQLPLGSVDCHHHIYDHKFPYSAGVTLRPPEATVADYRLLQVRLGTSRNVVVQPSSYGTDNSCLMDALTQFGAAARGVAVIDMQTPDAELHALNAAGVRGIRFNLSRPAGAGAELLELLAERIAPLGWHVQVHTLGNGYPAMESILQRLPTPIVIDHLGRIPQPGGLQHPGYDVLRRLVDRGNTWIKLSGAYHDSHVGAPTYADSADMTHAWLTHAPERVVWGTDWPHPAAMVGEKPMPDDALLVDLLGRSLPLPSQLHAVMVTNPEKLYGFSPALEQL